MILRGLIIWIFLAVPAAAQEEQIVAGLSQSNVSITTNFEGSEILIYGAVKRETPPPQTPQLDVIVTVEGPPNTLKVRRKDHRFGVWLNNAEVKIDSAPSFYAVATTAPLAKSLLEIEDLRYRITIPRAIRAVGITAEAEGAPLFVDALLRIREDEGRYVLRETSVELSEDTLFRTDMSLPAALTEGDYLVRIYLTRGGRVVDTLERAIFVRKAGVEQFFYEMAHEQPLLYGLMSLLMAALAGWGASVLFSRWRW